MEKAIRPVTQVTGQHHFCTSTVSLLYLCCISTVSLLLERGKYFSTAETCFIPRASLTSICALSVVQTVPRLVLLPYKKTNFAGTVLPCQLFRPVA